MEDKEECIARAIYESAIVSHMEGLPGHMHDRAKRVARRAAQVSLSARKVFFIAVGIQAAAMRERRKRKTRMAVHVSREKDACKCVESRAKSGNIRVWFAKQI